jgi:hypothetical protein
MEYVAAYLFEESLSVDNIFAFVVIFSELHIPAEQQRRVLLFGVAGALVFRAVAIGAGITLIERVQWITYPAQKDRGCARGVRDIAKRCGVPLDAVCLRIVLSTKEPCSSSRNVTYESYLLNESNCACTNEPRR